ncbi:unnamed protein product [Sphagnum jensenii]|uniref:Uncharacterized protein n=1 Tax=Sphagnum jensenii TaxID=128206 RepID=A0ABP1B7S2_9BRYO
MDNPTDSTAAPPGPNLKYLSFVHTVLLQATVYLTTSYTTIKESSGFMKPRLDRFEGTIKDIIAARPFYAKIKGLPLGFLQYVDSKVDPTMVLVVPPFVRLKCYQLCDLAIEGTYSARGILSEMQAQGRLYKTATDAAEQLTYIAWQNILALPYASKVTSLAAPVAKFSAMRYNSIVALLKKNKVPLAFLAPLVPIERIEQAAMRSTGALPN